MLPFTYNMHATAHWCIFFLNYVIYCGLNYPCTQYFIVFKNAFVLNIVLYSALFHNVCISENLNIALFWVLWNNFVSPCCISDIWSWSCFIPVREPTRVLLDRYETGWIYVVLLCNLLYPQTLSRERQLLLSNVHLLYFMVSFFIFMRYFE